MNFLRSAYCLVDNDDNIKQLAVNDDQIKFGSSQYYILCAIGGALSCGLTHTMLTPLDLIKCRIQVNPSYYRNISTGFLLSYQYEGGLRGLTRGWLPTAIGYSLQGLGKFGFYELFKNVYSNILGPNYSYEYRTSLYLAASATAELFADIALSPFEACKVRMQTIPDSSGKFRTIAKTIYREEGINGFYKGLQPLWFRQIPYTMMKFSCFERTIELLYRYVVPKPRDQCNKQEQLMITFISGYIAGIFCAVVSHPADTVVSKLNQTNSESSWIDVLKQLGPINVWKGLIPRIIMIGTLTATQWFIYDGFKVWLSIPRPPPPSSIPPMSSSSKN